MSKPETSGMLLERVVKYLVIHCSAAHYGDAATPVYHFYIARDGHVRQRLPLSVQGSHAKGFDRCSVGICYEGGADADGNPSDTRTLYQRYALHDLVNSLLQVFPEAKVMGHNRLQSYDRINRCPCFDVNTLFP